MLSHHLPDIPLEAIKRATRRRGGGPPVSHKRALEICRRLREIDLLLQAPTSIADLDEIVGAYMMLESELFGLGKGAGD